MRCTDCDVPVASDDNYCRRCGAALRIIEVPAVRGESRAITAWEEAKPAVTQGVILIAAGALLRFVLGRAGKAAISRAVSLGEESLDPRQIIPFAGGRPSARRGDDLEVFWYRRVRR